MENARVAIAGLAIIAAQLSINVRLRLVAVILMIGASAGCSLTARPQQSEQQAI